jgi:uncharacterized membrane protein YphA (DoxX/SURF4 family)
MLSRLPSILAYGVYITEIVALLIFVGYRTRLAAAILGTLFAFLTYSRSIFIKRKWWLAIRIGIIHFCVDINLYWWWKMAASSSNRWD